MTSQTLILYFHGRTLGVEQKESMRSVHLSIKFLKKNGRDSGTGETVGSGVSGGHLARLDT